MAPTSQSAERPHTTTAQRYNLPEERFSVAWDFEKWWVDHQPWLESHGYMLRPRYRPDWTPSWYADGMAETKWNAEDCVVMSYAFILDATRISDGAFVILKRVDKRRHPTEVEITSTLCSPPYSSDPRNHCVPVLEVLQDPEDENFQLMVLPLLRNYANPRFDTVGEAVVCFRQIVQSVRLMHANKIAHRDIHPLNIMMDASPLYMVPFHPMRPDMRRDYKGDSEPTFTRTERPVKYYLIDPGLAVQYDTVDPPPLEIPVLGGDKTVPEFVANGMSKPYNPFPTDVYYLGNWIRQDFLEGHRSVTGGVLSSKRLGFEFLRSLVDDMTQSDSSKRPTINEVEERFESLVASLSSWKLRSRVAKQHDNPFHSMYLSTAHWLRRVKLVALRRAAVPSPSR
ncbi:hypothetical protein K523DRAFT_283738, partial [Schizophyllum commune Tattone D]